MPPRAGPSRPGRPGRPASQRGGPGVSCSSRLMRMLGSARSRWAASATRSSGVPRRSAAYTVLPAACSSRARSPAVPGAVRMAALGCASAAASARCGSRPWAETTRASSQSRPIFAKASATEETAGMTRGVMPRARRARTTPKKPGSPEASTTVGPGCVDMASRVWSRCLSSMCSACGGTGATRRCRGAPITVRASARAFVASDPAGRPSQPITVTFIPRPRRSSAGR